MNKRTSISSNCFKLLKLSLFFCIIFAFASLSGCLLDEEENSPPREVRWGLKIQIGQYVKDSIFPPPESLLVDSPNFSRSTYSIRMDSICYYEPGCDTVPRTVKVYGWDSTCFSGLSMTSLMGGGGENFPVDSNGIMDWSGDGFSIALPGGVSFILSPMTIDVTKCRKDYDYPTIIRVHFNMYTFDSWGEHGL